MSNILRLWFWLGTITLFSGSCLGQFVGEAKRTKAVYLEAFGSSDGGMSINFDMRLSRGQLNGLGFRAGMGTTASPRNARRYHTYFIPVLVNKVFGGNRRAAMEVGLGATLFNTTWHYDLIDTLYTTGSRHERGARCNANIGVRLRPLRKGLLVRLYVAPYLEPDLRTARMWGGFSLGYGFR